MPVMDGIEATKAIIEQDLLEKCPIIGLSAFADEKDKERAIEAGMNGYLTKPIGKEELVKALAEINIEQ